MRYKGHLKKNKLPQKHVSSKQKMYGDIIFDAWIERWEDIEAARIAIFQPVSDCWRVRLHAQSMIFLSSCSHYLSWLFMDYPAIVNGLLLMVGFSPVLFHCNPDLWSNLNIFPISMFMPPDFCTLLLLIIPTHHDWPLSAMIGWNHYQPLSASINPCQLSTIINQYKPLLTILNQYQPISTTTNHS